jgi:predicted negative regulator of RcsB-dependent stress response
MEKLHSRVNLIVAWSVFAVTLGIYLYMLAPSISFWDCGEYVAAGSSLGVPHPPGNPFFVMIARTASVLLPFIKNPAFRINVLTPLFGAFTALLVYLSIGRILIGFIGTPDTSWKRLTIYVSGIVGSLFAAFGNTVLFSAVEAEVNMPLLLPIMLSTWLTLVWSQSKDPKRDRLLLLIAYICFLGIGIHMYSMITLLPVFLFVVISDRSKLVDWRLWATALSMGLVIYDISLFLYVGSSVTVITLIISFFEGKNQPKWRFCFQIAAIAFLGFSTHLYIPIRSSLNPSIDENHPATFQAFNDYLDRKQYGSESMISRMAWRRASWGNQFGVEGHMGFGGFLATQFFHFSLDDTKVNWFVKSPTQGAMKFVVYSLPVIFMILGLFSLLKKSRKVAIFIITTVFLNTVAMVIYMNFADGTKAEKRDYISWEKSNKQGPMPVVQREVRVRDYFYITGFMYYGLCIGLSSGLFLFTLYSNRRKFLSTTLAPLATVLLVVSPALPMTQNIPINNRHGDTIPYDYAYNLLMSCEQNGILFTNGDNDTFPLWALQEAFNFRKDVRIVNLSLLNTDWYILQLKNNEPKLNITIPDNEIKKLNHMYNPFQEPTPYHLPSANITVTIPGRQQLQLLQIQHQMILHIVDANKWNKPVYFANTVSDDNFLGLDQFLSMQGFAYRIMPSVVSADKKFDIKKTEYMIDNVYKFRGLDSWRARNDETTENLVSNYSALFLKIGLAARENITKRNTEIDNLKKQLTEKPSPAIDSTSKALQNENTKDFDYAMQRLNQCTKIIPWDWRPYMLRQELFVSAGKLKEAENEIQQAVNKYPENIELLRLEAQFLMDNNKVKDALPTLKRLTMIDNDPSYAFYALARAYQENGLYDSAHDALMGLKKSHPNEPQVEQLISQNELMRNQHKPAAIPK